MIDYSIVAAKKAGAVHPVHPYSPVAPGNLYPKDCPFPYGTTEAKLWWNNIFEPHVKTSITPAMKAKYGNRVLGAFNGKPLVPGEPGQDQGDMAFLISKLQVTQGLSPQMSYQLALKARQAKYGF